MTDQPPNQAKPIAKYGYAKCINCRKVFPKGKPWSKFCRGKCRDTWHNDQRALKDVSPSEIEVIKK